MDRKNLSISTVATEKANDNGKIEINTNCSVISWLTDGSDASELAKDILIKYYWEGMDQLVEAGFDITLNLTLTGEVLIELFQNAEQLKQLLPELQETRSQNQEMQEEIIGLTERIEAIRKWEEYMLEKLEFSLSRPNIRTVGDMIEEVREEWWISTIASRLKHWYAKKDALSFLNSVFKIWKYPDDLAGEKFVVFHFWARSKTKTWSPNDKLKSRLMQGPLSSYEWKSMKELFWNANSGKFYEFALECFFAWVNLKP